MASNNETLVKYLIKWLVIGAFAMPVANNIVHRTFDLIEKRLLKVEVLHQESRKVEIHSSP
ncbi:MAG TPA: hypothetical protein VD884_17545 [Ohtaekwangia sp.]|nr:hypothetical protein [Ohtaekwangia sp.]